MTLFDALKDGEEYVVDLCPSGEAHRYEYFDTVAISDDDGEWIDEVLICKSCGIKSHGKTRIGASRD